MKGGRKMESAERGVRNETSQEPEAAAESEVRKPRQADSRAEAEALFMLGGNTLKEIALAVGVNAETVKRWSAAGRWHDRRLQARGARAGERPHATLEALRSERAKLVKMMQETDDPDEKAKRCADVHKVSEVIEKMEKRLKFDTDQMLNVMYRFGRFVRRHAQAEEVATVTRWIEKFFAADARAAENGE
jgi:transposase